MRAAAVGGAAYYAGKKVQEGRDEDAMAETEAEAYGEEPAEGISDAAIEQLRKLSQLKDQGVLTQDEFDAEKRKILGT